MVLTAKLYLVRNFCGHAHNNSPNFYHNRMNGIGTHRIQTDIHIYIYRLRLENSCIYKKFIFNLTTIYQSFVRNLRSHVHNNSPKFHHNRMNGIGTPIIQTDRQTYIYLYLYVYIDIQGLSHRKRNFCNLLICSSAN